MSDNSNLHRANAKADDEFFTLYEDVERQMERRRDVFYGTTVHCPCDSADSAFYKYFSSNFHRLHLKRLICTQYNDYGGKGRVFDTDAGMEWKDLECDGSFESWDVGKLMQDADFVVTNSPFSLLPEFFARLNELQKDFLIIVPKSAFGYKGVRRKLVSGDVDVGAPVREFLRPDGSIETLGNTHWIGDWQLIPLHDPLPLTAVYSPATHPRYDNYPEAIECRSLELIPCDWKGVMGVPLTIFTRLNRLQFSVLGFDRDLCGDCFVDGKGLFRRVFIQRKDME